MYARLKICLYVVFLVALFIVQDVRLHIFAAGTVLFFTLVILPIKKMKSGFLPIFLFLLFTFGGNLFFHSGKILYNGGFFSITDEGLSLAALRTLRVFSMIFAAKILTSVLTVDEMIQAMARMLGPVERVGLPVKDFFSVMGLTLKSFPILMAHLLKTYREETANNEVRGFTKRLRHTVSFLMPVFVKSICAPESFFESEEKRKL